VCVQTVGVDEEDSKCLATADVTSTDTARPTADHLSRSSPVADDPSRHRRSSSPQPTDVNVAKVFPVEANVVLVTRPGELPAEVVVAHNDSSRLSAADEHASNDAGHGQSSRTARRPRKRSSLCNNIAVDDVFLDDQSDTRLQPDALNTAAVKRTSVPHQRHADAERRPKQHKGKHRNITCWTFQSRRLVTSQTTYLHCSSGPTRG